MLKYWLTHALFSVAFMVKVNQQNMQLSNAVFQNKKSSSTKSTTKVISLKCCYSFSNPMHVVPFYTHQHETNMLVTGVVFPWYPAFMGTLHPSISVCFYSLLVINLSRFISLVIQEFEDCNYLLSLDIVK